VFAINSAFETFTRTTTRAQLWGRIRERFSRGDDHLQTQSFQATNQPVLCPLWMLVIEEITAKLVVLSLIAQDRKSRYQDLMSYRDNRFLTPRRALNL
jgi:hypothetical protein